MPRQIAYNPETGALQNCLSVIVEMRPDRMVEIESINRPFKQKGKRDVVSFDSLTPSCSWKWREGDIGLTTDQVRRKLGKRKVETRNKTGHL